MVDRDFRKLKAEYGDDVVDLYKTNVVDLMDRLQNNWESGLGMISETVKNRKTRW